MLWKSTFFSALIIHLCSSGGGQRIDADVLLHSNFPPAKPDVYNLNALCLYGNRRLRYTPENFPASSFGYVHRAGKLLNRLESWFAQCCYGGIAADNNAILCCVRQAWEAGMSHYCSEEFAIKTLAHECCEKNDDERTDCFQQNAPNPFYKPLSRYVAPLIPADLAFIWDTHDC